MRNYKRVNGITEEDKRLTEIGLLKGKGRIVVRPEHSEFHSEAIKMMLKGATKQEVFNYLRSVIANPGAIIKVQERAAYDASVKTAKSARQSIIKSKMNLEDIELEGREIAEKGAVKIKSKEAESQKMLWIPVDRLRQNLNVTTKADELAHFRESILPYVEKQHYAKGRMLSEIVNDPEMGGIKLDKLRSRMNLFGMPIQDRKLFGIKKSEAQKGKKFPKKKTAD